MGWMESTPWLHPATPHHHRKIYRRNDIAQFLVWIAPDEIQRSIKTAIDGAFAKKRNAITLLNAARRAVEIAIESDESTALEFLARQENQL